jgi:hypothetical protein
MRKLLTLVAVALTCSVEARASEDVELTQSDVLAMMALVPTQLAHGKPAGFERSRDAKEIATAIAEKVHGDRWWASRLVVYGAYESGFRNRASGDGGKAHGFLQLQQVPMYVAVDPRLAIDAWMTKANYSLEHCASNPPEERLAALASGDCNHGRMVARHRDELALRIAGEVQWARYLSQGMGE